MKALTISAMIATVAGIAFGMAKSEGLPTSVESFAVDRSVMSDLYWKIWNSDEQMRIDAEIERYRKADAVVDFRAVPEIGVSSRQ